jgi:tetratricopeptide (TPR) repeat protein
MYNEFDEQQLNSNDSLNLLFEKYSKIFEANPHSTVFAPLAECFRKMGRKDKALSLLREGIKNHPDYLLGYLGLAQCYFELEQLNLAYNTLRPLIEKNRENIRLQRLFAKICEGTNHETEALESYKVRNLEDPILQKLEEKAFSFKEDKISDFFESDKENNWESVNFQKLEILDKMAHFSHRKGDLKSASEFVELSLTINPKDIWAQNRARQLKANDPLRTGVSKSSKMTPQKITHKLLDFLEKIKKRSFQVQSGL